MRNASRSLSGGFTMDTIAGVGITPTKELDFFDGAMGMKIFGRDENFPEGLKFSDGQRLSQILSHWGTQGLLTGTSRILAPIPSFFNAQIWDGKTKFPEAQEIETGYGIKILRPGCFDGVTLEYPNDGFLLLAAGCAVFTLRVPVLSFGGKREKIFVTHAGRDSLGPFNDIRHGKDRLDFRIPGSVVESIANQVRRDGGNMKEAWAHISCAIGAEHFDHPFDHPQHGAGNKAMIEYIIGVWGRECIVGPVDRGCISLKCLIRHQLIGQGMFSGMITEDDIDTHGDVNHAGVPLYHSTRRGDTTARTSIFIYQNQ